jgi:hypothetical protein
MTHNNGVNPTVWPVTRLLTGDSHDRAHGARPLSANK